MTATERVGPILAKARDDGLINFRVRYENYEPIKIQVWLNQTRQKYRYFEGKDMWSKAAEYVLSLYLT